MPTLDRPAVRQLSVSRLTFPTLLLPSGPYEPLDEVVERKGVGHPDSICDHLAEALAAALTRHFLDRHGRRFHFNVDKALLAAGAVEVGFGGGRVLRPTRIVLAGKIDRRAGALPIEELVEAAYARLFEILPWATREAYTIEIWLERSSDDLALLLEQGDAAARVPLSNDTSIGSAFAGRTPLEAAVHAIERAIARPAFRAAWPVGADVKVLGTRFTDVHRFVVAAAVLANGVKDAAAYRGVVRAVRAEVARVALQFLAPRDGTTSRIEVGVNGADQGPDGAYLTLTGSSAEAGDDGQVGRGNRIGGLITPCRLASMEAACGKNPSAHVGKLYHALAWDAAHLIAAQSSLQSVSVTLTSRIGAPVDRPERVSVRTYGHEEQVDERFVAEAVRDAVGDWARAVRRLEAGGYELA
ncbi:methionine adenosyltransferase [soil metagenome]